MSGAAPRYDVRFTDACPQEQRDRIAQGLARIDASPHRNPPAHRGRTDWTPNRAQVAAAAKRVQEFLVGADGEVEEDAAEPVVDLARLTREIQVASIGLQDAERNVDEAEKKATNAREIAAQRRLDLGRLLVEARKAWPARGPKAKGWGEFLVTVGIDQDAALRYMALAGYVQEISRTGDGVRETVPTYADAGIDKRERKEPREFHILIDAGKFRSSVEKLAKKWPDSSRPHLPRILRELADEIESGIGEGDQ